MRVTDEMVDAAIAADSHASWWASNNREGAEKRMRAALEAALAVEPADEITRLTARVAELDGDRTFPLGTRVTKIRGSSWTGHVVGYYSTSLNPDGICVESENEPGSVQVYPATALEPKP